VIRAPNHWGRPKVPKMSQVLSSTQLIYSQKTLGSNKGAPNLLLAPGAIWPRYAPGHVRDERGYGGDDNGKYCSTNMLTWGSGKQSKAGKDLNLR